MDKSRPHQRSASTTTGSLSNSAVKTRRPKAYADRADSAEPHEQRKDADGSSDGSDMTSSDDFELDDIVSENGLEDDEETGLTSQDRQKRRKRKRRGTLLNERVAPGADTREEELRLANSSFWSAVIMNSVLIGLWYLFSIAITVVSICIIHSLVRGC
jgi:solute carrier family 35 protein C2